jgi:hypothetical protein
MRMRVSRPVEQPLGAYSVAMNVVCKSHLSTTCNLELYFAAAYNFMAWCQPKYRYNLTLASLQAHSIFVKEVSLLVSCRTGSPACSKSNL